jgi:hypothetical protein
VTAVGNGGTAARTPGWAALVARAEARLARRRRAYVRKVAAGRMTEAEVVEQLRVWDLMIRLMKEIG